MRQVTPKVFLVAVTRFTPGFDAYLREIGNPTWHTDAKTEGDALVEAAGRLCYRSWQPYDPTKPDCSNANVERVREGNQEYVANLLKQGHGSVLEHCNVTFIFHNVSRSFTHELVRHRAGMGYSQESLRYVRLTDIKAWLPRSLDSLESGDSIKELFRETITYLEGVQVKLAEMADIDHGKGFKAKKQLTSMFRRLAPIGLATTIMATGNLRAWRHIVNMRASEAAEEEMQVVMDQVAPMLKDNFPACFQDLRRTEEGVWSFGLNPKV